MGKGAAEYSLLSLGRFRSLGLATVPSLGRGRFRWNLPWGPGKRPGPFRPGPLSTGRPRTPAERRLYFALAMAQGDRVLRLKASNACREEAIFHLGYVQKDTFPAPWVSCPLSDKTIFRLGYGTRAMPPPVRAEGSPGLGAAPCPAGIFRSQGSQWSPL